MIMKIKSIILTLALSVLAITGTAFANLASTTDSIYPIRFDQITYGQSPVWKVTNYSPDKSFVVRFVQPSGFTATLFLAAGESTNLGNFEAFREFSCPSGWTPQVVATGGQPVYADFVAGNATSCKAN
jgi:hypothetical protein